MTRRFLPLKPIRHPLLTATIPRLGDIANVLNAQKQKLKTKNLKSHKRKLVTYKGAPIILSAEFATETFQARRAWHEIFKVLKSKGL